MDDEAPRSARSPRSRRGGAGPASKRTPRLASRRVRRATFAAIVAVGFIAVSALAARSRGLFKNTDAPPMLLSADVATVDDRPVDAGIALPFGATLHARGGVACFRVETDGTACLDRGGRAKVVSRDARRTLVDLVEGRLAVALDPNDDDEVAVRTRAGTTVINGGEVVVDVDDEAGTSARVDVIEGSAKLEPRLGYRKHLEAHRAASLGGDSRALFPDEEGRDRTLLDAIKPR